LPWRVAGTSRRPWGSTSTTEGSCSCAGVTIARVSSTKRRCEGPSLPLDVGSRGAAWVHVLRCGGPDARGPGQPPRLLAGQPCLDDGGPGPLARRGRRVRVHRLPVCHGGDLRSTQRASYQRIGTLGPRQMRSKAVACRVVRAQAVVRLAYQVDGARPMPRVAPVTGVREGEPRAGIGCQPQEGAGRRVGQVRRATGHARP